MYTANIKSKFRPFQINMDKISTIKENILYFLEKQGITKASFYDKTEISASNFKGSGLKSEIGGDKIVKILSVYPEINPEWLLTAKGEMLRSKQRLVAEPGAVYQLKTDRMLKEQSIPLYDLEATAGVVELFSKSGTNKPIDYISIPNLPKCDGAIYVTGDSMYPLLKSGDIIMYKELSNSIDNIFFGEMYLISINQDGNEYVTVKWIQKSDKGDDYIKIASQNSHHDPKDIHIKDVRAFALIKASIRINSMS